MTRLALAAWLLPLSVVAGTSEKLPVIPVTGRPYRTSAFKPPGGFSNFTLASDGRIFFSCQLGGDSKPRGLFMLVPGGQPSGPRGADARHVEAPACLLIDGHQLLGGSVTRIGTA